MGWYFLLIVIHILILFLLSSREGEFVDRIKGLSYEEITTRGGGILNSAEKLQQVSEDELYEGAFRKIK